MKSWSMRRTICSASSWAVWCREKRLHVAGVNYCMVLNISMGWELPIAIWNSTIWCWTTLASLKSSISDAHASSRTLLKAVSLSLKVNYKKIFCNSSTDPMPFKVSMDLIRTLRLKYTVNRRMTRENRIFGHVVWYLSAWRSGDSLGEFQGRAILRFERSQRTKTTSNCDCWNCFPENRALSCRVLWNSTRRVAQVWKLYLQIPGLSRLMYAQWRSLALDTSIMYWCLHRSKHCREETLSSSRPSRREQSQRKKSVDGLLVSMLLVLDRHNFHQRQRKCRIISVASNSMSPHQIFFISLSKTHIPQ